MAGVGDREWHHRVCHGRVVRPENHSQHQWRGDTPVLHQGKVHATWELLRGFENSKLLSGGIAGSRGHPYHLPRLASLLQHHFHVTQDLVRQHCRPETIRLASTSGQDRGLPGGLPPRSADDKDGPNNQSQIPTRVWPLGLPQALVATYPGRATKLRLRWAGEGGGDTQPYGCNTAQGQVPTAFETRCGVCWG